MISPVPIAADPVLPEVSTVNVKDLPIYTNLPKITFLCEKMIEIAMLFGNIQYKSAKYNISNRLEINFSLAYYYTLVYNVVYRL